MNEPTYEARLDKDRLDTMLGRVFMLMKDAKWRTVPEIAAVVPGSHTGISARLRDLRKEKFGGHILNRRRRGEPEDGLWEFQLLVQEPRCQMARPAPGTVAVCRKGLVGLILRYQERTAYGINLETGGAWQSKHPEVLCRIMDVLDRDYLKELTQDYWEARDEQG